MAIMKLTAFNGGMKGKIGGTIFQGSTQGQVVKNAPIISGKIIDALGAGSKLTRADAGRGLDMQRFVTICATAWRELSSADRSTWNTGAINFPFKNKFGDSYTPSGFQVFMSINTKLLQMGVAQLNVIPAPGGLVDPGVFSVAYDGSIPEYAITFTPAIAGYKLLLDSTRPMSIGKKQPSSGYFNIYQFDGSETSAFNFTQWWRDYFGSLPTNATINFRLRCQNLANAQYGVPQYFQLNY